MHRLVEVERGGWIDRDERNVGEIGLGEPRLARRALGFGQHLGRERLGHANLSADRREGLAQPVTGRCEANGSTWHPASLRRPPLSAQRATRLEVDTERGVDPLAEFPGGVLTPIPVSVAKSEDECRYHPSSIDLERHRKRRRAPMPTPASSPWWPTVRGRRRGRRASRPSSWARARGSSKAACDGSARAHAA